MGTGLFPEDGIRPRSEKGGEEALRLVYLRVILNFTHSNVLPFCC